MCFGIRAVTWLIVAMGHTFNSSHMDAWLHFEMKQVWIIFQHGGLMLWGAAKPNQVVGKRPIESKITK